MGLRGCAVARPERVSGVAGPEEPEALERGEGRRAGASGSLLAEGAARRRALLVRGKLMVGWLCRLLLAMAGATAGGENSGQVRKTASSAGPGHPLPLQSRSPSRCPPSLTPTSPQAPSGPPRVRPAAAPTFSRQISPGSALPATRPSWPRPLNPIGCAAAAVANRRCRRKRRNRVANQRAQPRQGGKSGARRAGHAGSCSPPAGTPRSPFLQCSYGPHPRPSLPRTPSATSSSYIAFLLPPSLVSPRSQYSPPFLPVFPTALLPLLPVPTRANPPSPCSQYPQSSFPVVPVPPVIPILPSYCAPSTPHPVCQSALLPALGASPAKKKRGSWEPPP